MSNLKNLYTEEEKEQIARKMARKTLLDYCYVVDPNYGINWHFEVIANKLQDAYVGVLNNKRSRIILELPPRHGKSELATIKFPSWILGESPGLPVIVASYSQDLANDFGLATKDAMGSNNYRAIFDTQLRADTKAKAKWMTTEGKGGYTAVGVGGPITGKGFKIGIIDDPIKNREEADSLVIRDKIWKWYTSTFLTREDGNGAVIIIMTRWHDDDLVGRILNNEGAEEWDVVKFPAIAEEDEEFRLKGEALWEDRFPLEILLNRKRDVGPYDWSALYQQDPVDVESQEFKREWFKYRSMEEIDRLTTRRFITIDPASAMRDKSDFIGIVVNCVDRENKWNFISYKVKMNSADLISFMFKLNNDYKPEAFGIEEGVYQQVLKPFLDDEMKKRNKFFTIITLKHQQQNKHLRIRGLIPRYSSGSIFHIEGMCGDLEGELVRFPKAINDDVADAGAYQLQMAKPIRLHQAVASEPIKGYYPELGL